MKTEPIPNRPNCRGTTGLTNRNTPEVIEVQVELVDVPLTPSNGPMRNHTYTSSKSENDDLDSITVAEIPAVAAVATSSSTWQAVASTREHLVEFVMDYIIREIQEVTFTKLVKWTCSTLMIFGGVVPFIPQYREIKKKQDAEGFSLYVCLVLIFANTLRILFWFGKRYELPLLIQSFIMNIAMLLMIHLCVSVKRKMHLAHFQEHTFTDFDWKYFWAWTDFQSYLDFLIVMVVFCSLLTFLLIKSTIFVETLGLVALLSEAMLGVPQLVKNFQYKSTEGMSVLMVLMWMVGDVFKTTYFVLREAPAQFWICGGLQVFIDILILYQVYLYRDSLNINLPHAGRID